MAVKRSIAAGWNHSYHKQRLLKYRDRYFKDVQGLLGVLEGDHYETFYENFEPIDDDLNYLIQEYQKLSVPAGKERHARDILKIVDNLKRRQRAYELYAKPSL